MPRTCNLTEGRKIPRPIHVSRRLMPVRGTRDKPTLADQMRLSGSKDQLLVYCKTVEKIANCVEEFHFPPMVQCKYYHKWETFVTLIRQQSPLLDNYEEYWPIEWIVSVHRMRRSRPSAGGRIGLMHWTRQMSIKSSTTEQNSIVPEDEAEIPQTLAPSTSLADTEPPRQQLDMSTNPYIPTLARSIIRHFNTLATVNTLSKRTCPRSPASSIVTPSTTAPLTGGSASILAFLSALVPSQSALLPTFLDMGINDLATLQGLRDMKGRDRWLYTWVKEGLMTEFQFAIVVEGLKGQSGSCQ